MYSRTIDQSVEMNIKLVKALVSEAVNDGLLSDVYGAKIQARGEKGVWLRAYRGERRAPKVTSMPESFHNLKRFSRVRLYESINSVLRDCARKSNLGLTSLEVQFLGKKGEVVAVVALT